MDDPLAVRLAQRVRDLGAEPEHVGERQRSFREPILERLAVDELHDQEVDAALAPDVVQRADVRMVERRHRARFALEPLAPLHIVRQRSRQYLDGDGSIEARVARFVDLAHPARAERREDLVRSEAQPWLEGHGSEGIITTRCPARRGRAGLAVSGAVCPAATA